MTTIKRRKAMTLAEHDEFLKSEGRYEAVMAEQAKRDEEFAKKEAEGEVAEAPLVAALRAAGTEVSSAWDLLRIKEPYPEILPVLMEHLDKPYPTNIREGIARALAVREARPYWHVLVERFLAEPASKTNQMKWALHLAVANSADASVLEELIRLAIDRRLGRNRALMVDALVRIGGPLANATLDELESDPDLVSDFARVTKKPRR